MTIQELGSIGELVAAIATVATLIYLALQIRGSTAATHAEARRSLDLDGNTAVRCIVSDAELSRLFMLGLGKPEALDPEQAFRFRLLMSHYFSAQDTVWKEVRLGTMTHAQLLENIDRARPFLETRGGKAWWRENQGMFPQAFRDFFESTLPQMKS